MSTRTGVFYYGGCGGFYTLHLLLLSSKYGCIFETGEDFETVHKNQWVINDLSTWKRTENHVIATMTEASDIENKIFLFCGEDQLKTISKFNGTTIFVYTDPETQYYLTKTKRANYFQKMSLIDHRNNSALIAYNNVKSETWPYVNSFEELCALPSEIVSELVNDFGVILDLDAYEEEHKPEIMKVLQSNTDTLLASNIPDIAVKFQDLIKTSGKILYDQLGLEHNQKCIDFTERYLALHTPEQRAYLLGS